MRFLMSAAGAALLLIDPAAAQERIVDISTPEGVAKVLLEEGYKAEIKKNDDGDPFILSAANGSSFTIEFYGCEKDVCTSAQFFAWYKKEPWYSVELVNRWNAEKRFIKAAIDKDGDFATYMDVTTLGKTTYANFADTIDWWSVMSGEVSKFLDEEDGKLPKKES
ncbi:YbjN domain-containing protein [Sphingomonas sp. DT-207]|uniref:YbjN domain-containing protein n=1 Tax=Sphingomonas sp. DT-207 TaxID=3396167 RepID=UPI003F1DC259